MSSLTLFSFCLFPPKTFFSFFCLFPFALRVVTARVVWKEIVAKTKAKAKPEAVIKARVNDEAKPKTDAKGKPKAVAGIKSKLELNMKESDADTNATVEVHDKSGSEEDFY